jgi:hypothetical protein
MSFRPLLLISLVALTSCAYFKEQQIQDITVETPGAENAICYVYVEGFKYKVRPPATLMVSKSSEDLVVDCLAPGNRRKKEIFEPTVSKKIYGDMLFPPFLGWDAASRAIYKYPDIITVDFTHTPVRPEDLPNQNRPDVKQPEEYPMEEILPGEPVRNSDRYERPFQLYPRAREAPAEGAGPYMIETTTTTISHDKGDLKSVVNPGGTASTPAAKPATGPAYPGQ